MLLKIIILMKVMHFYISEQRPLFVAKPVVFST